jgi:kinesin family protein 18/19
MSTSPTPPFLEAERPKTATSPGRAQAAGSACIQVAVRIRPLNSREVAEGKREIVKVVGPNVVVMHDEGDHRCPEKQYSYNYALGPETTQQQVFDQTARPLVNGVINGFNGTVFAYGATGAGKTHTMLGTPTCPGVMLHSLQVRRPSPSSSWPFARAHPDPSSLRPLPLPPKHLFSSLEADSRKAIVKIQYLEVYNEYIHDLLIPHSENLDIREDALNGMAVAHLTEVETTSLQHTVKLLYEGNARRTVESTRANEASSRSHAVLQVIVKIKEAVSGVSAALTVGKLSLVDLAGSERAAATNNRGMRMVEGANINRSLLALGNCINALSDRAKNPHSTKNQYVPYRDSKLTRLLKDSLGGNCHTTMICNVHPTTGNTMDTSNTLRYAARASTIRQRVEKQVRTNPSSSPLLLLRSVYLQLVAHHDISVRPRLTLLLLLLLLLQVFSVAHHITNYTNIIDGKYDRPCLTGRAVTPPLN